MSANSDAKAELDRELARCYFMAVAPQPAKAAPVAWLPASPASRQLPFVGLPNPSGYTNLAESIRRKLRSAFDLDAPVVCHPRDFRPPAPGQESMIAVVEAAADSLPDIRQALNADDVQAIAFDDPQPQALLETWLRQYTRGVMPVGRVAWAAPGCRTRAEAWIGQQLAEQGLTATGPGTLA